MAEGLPDIYVRFDGIDGECMDEYHPGKQEPGGSYPQGVVFGWFAIKSFTFSFSANEAAEPVAATAGAPAAGARPAAAGARPAASGGRAPAAAAATTDAGPHSHPDISLSKTLDSVSATVWSTKCYGGQVIQTVEMECCRAGGISGAAKIPFVRMVFDSVYIKSVTMSISEDALPSETLVFSYEKVKVESIWTDNETGKRRIDQPRRFGWDFQNNQQWTG